MAVLKSILSMGIEQVNLSNCIFRPPCSFGGFHKLKSLSLNQVAFELNVATSFLCIPNLEYLSIDAIKWILIKDCGKLKLFAVTLSHEVSHHRQDDGMNLFLASGNVAGRLSLRLNDLIVLEFYDFDFNDEDQICSLLCILRSSPNLMIILRLELVTL
ncbi:F-box/FBD/LRR-repeat protein At1g13570-like [Nicotiana sylvestris]|uniref:F-box/FBD/LRR-repeat protein At1g13570-like n=1 Tax=Nicotiana sylvestris TaxID=4096 RepID=UPI00388C4398